MERKPLCPNCRLPHDPLPMEASLAACFDSQRAAMTALLHNVGERKTCRGCGVSIYWVTHRNNARTPYTPEGLNHFVNCPNSEMFRK